MEPYPLRPEPLLKPRVWGGRELERLGKALPKGEAIGESWELADLPDSIENGRNVIANGALRGQTLREAVSGHGEQIMGSARVTEEGGFPLLIKYLDARQNLSVQVHPTREYVARHPEAHLKSEAWVIIDAEPGAVIYKGVKPDVTPEAFARHVRTDEAVDDLVEVPVKRGECHYLPSGTCHALGAGIIVAEVQTPSDTTFRVYDWGRTGRELHIDQALECIRFGEEPMQQAEAQPPIEVEGMRTTRLVETEYFAIERIQALKAAGLEVVTNGLPVVWMVTQGGAVIRGGGLEERPAAGSTLLMPAALSDGEAHLEEGCEVLVVSLPSPLRGMIA